MQKHSEELKEKIRVLRGLGNSYGEINTKLNISLAKSTLASICQKTSLPPNYRQRIAQLSISNLNRGRAIAIELNKIRKEERLKKLDDLNFPISQEITNQNTAKIALAVLYLTEGAKYNLTRRGCLSLGNSNVQIINLFLTLLKTCYSFNLEKIRCTVQCRADQNIEELQVYWSKKTNIPRRLFYKSLIDPRTRGKPTLKPEYKGVLKIDYFDAKILYDLDSLAKLIYNFTSNWARSLNG